MPSAWNLTHGSGTHCTEAISRGSVISYRSRSAHSRIFADVQPAGLRLDRQENLRLHRRNGEDHLQPGRGEDAESRVELVEALLKGIKASIHVILMCDIAPAARRDMFHQCRSQVVSQYVAESAVEVVAEPSFSYN